MQLIKLSYTAVEPVQPQTEWQYEIITHAHASLHAGQSAIKRRIRAHFWFPGLDNAVRMHVESCHHCQVHSTNPTKVPLSSAPAPKQPWESVSLDLFGPLPDHSHILVFPCNLSHFAKIVKSTHAEHVLPALASIHNNFGSPMSTNQTMAHHLTVTISVTFLNKEASPQNIRTPTIRKGMTLSAS